MLSNEWLGSNASDLCGCLHAPADHEMHGDGEVHTPKGEQCH